MWDQNRVQFSCLFVCLFVSSCLDVFLFVFLSLCLLSFDVFGHILEEIDRYPALTNHAPANSVRPQWMNQSTNQSINPYMLMLMPESSKGFRFKPRKTTQKIDLANLKFDTQKNGWSRCTYDCLITQRNSQPPNRHLALLASNVLHWSQLFVCYTENRPTVLSIGISWAMGYISFREGIW